MLVALWIICKLYFEPPLDGHWVEFVWDYWIFIHAVTILRRSERFCLEILLCISH